MKGSRITIRKFRNNDKAAIRKISCETAFLGEPNEFFFDDDEILADALTLYYTEYEPGSCFVALSENEIVGYIIGTTDINAMNRIFIRRIIPRLLNKALRKRVLFKKNIQRFIINIILSFLKGEFLTPDFSKQYPAALHVNIDKAFRGRNIGRRLVEDYLGFLKRKEITGVHFGTMSETAKVFFARIGFTLLFSSKRSYLRYYFREDISYYIFGKLLDTNT